jgi:hypothetical protein
MERRRTERKARHPAKPRAKAGLAISSHRSRTKAEVRRTQAGPLFSFRFSPCDFRPSTLDFRLLPLPHSLLPSPEAPRRLVVPKPAGDGRSLARRRITSTFTLTLTFTLTCGEPSRTTFTCGELSRTTFTRAPCARACPPSCRAEAVAKAEARRAKEVPARHSPQGDGGFIFA